MEQALILKSYAMQVHETIMNSKASAAAALMEMCKGLKKMRDDRLFHSLGYDDFDVYCEEMAKIRSRQAYNYIATYERLGEEFVQSNASLGITKLELISRLPGDVAQEIVESGEAESMSTRDIKALVEENKRMTGQITLIEDQLREMTAQSEELSKRNGELEEQAQGLRETNEELQEQLFNRPIEVVEKEISDDERKKIAAQATASAEIRFAERERELLKKKETEAADKIEKAKKGLAKKHEEEIAEKEGRIKVLRAENENMARELAEYKKKQNSEVSEGGAGKSEAIKVYFETIKVNFNSAIKVVDEMEESEREKYASALRKLLVLMNDVLDDSLGGDDEDLEEEMEKAETEMAEDFAEEEEEDDD